MEAKKCKRGVDTGPTMGHSAVQPMETNIREGVLPHLSVHSAIEHLSLQQVIDLVVFYEVEARLRGVTLEDCALVARVANTARAEAPTAPVKGPVGS